MKSKKFNWWMNVLMTVLLVGNSAVSFGSSVYAVTEGENQATQVETEDAAADGAKEQAEVATGKESAPPEEVNSEPVQSEEPAKQSQSDPVIEKAKPEQTQGNGNDGQKSAQTKSAPAAVKTPRDLKQTTATSTFSVNVSAQLNGANYPSPSLNAALGNSMSASITTPSGQDFDYATYQQVIEKFAAGIKTPLGGYELKTVSTDKYSDLHAQYPWIPNESLPNLLLVNDANQLKYYINAYGQNYQFVYQPMAQVSNVIFIDQSTGNPIAVQPGTINSYTDFVFDANALTQAINQAYPTLTADGYSIKEVKVDGNVVSDDSGNLTTGMIMGNGTAANPKVEVYLNKSVDAKATFAFTQGDVVNTVIDSNLKNNIAGITSTPYDLGSKTVGDKVKASDILSKFKEKYSNLFSSSNEIKLTNPDQELTVKEDGTLDAPVELDLYFSLITSVNAIDNEGNPLSTPLKELVDRFGSFPISATTSGPFGGMYDLDSFLNGPGKILVASTTPVKGYDLYKVGIGTENTEVHDFVLGDPGIDEELLYSIGAEFTDAVTSGTSIGVPTNPLDNFIYNFTYRAQSQVANISFKDVDSNKIADPTATGTISGYTDQVLTRDQLIAEIKKIYDYDQNNYDLKLITEEGNEIDANFTFDNDAGTPQKIEVQLVHKIGDDQRTNPVNRTITYTGLPANLKPSDYGDTITLTINFKKDLVTNQPIPGSDELVQSGNTFPPVPSPKIDGYTANPVTESAQTITDMNQGPINRTVTYTPNQQTVKVTIRDQNNYKPFADKPASFSGASDASLTNAELQTQLKNIFDYSNYKLVSITTGDGTDITNQGFTFDNNDQVDQEITVVVEHNTIDQPQTNTVTRTINYVGLPPSVSTPPSVTQTVTVNYTQKYDQTLGELIPDTQVLVDGPYSWPSEKTPDKAGFKPDKDEVPAVPNLDWNTTSTTETVSYSEQKRVARVTFYDDQAKVPIINHDQLINGMAGSGIDLSKIWDFQAAGYKLVGDLPDLTFDINYGTEQLITIHLVHDTETITKSQDITRTITYQGADINPAPKQQTKIIEYSYTQDKVTKEKIDGTEKLVTGATFDPVPTPAVAGYTPDYDPFPSFTVEKWNQGDINETVTYTIDTQKANITFVDVDSNSPITISATGTITGDSGSQLKNSDLITAIRNVYAYDDGSNQNHFFQLSDIKVNKISIGTNGDFIFDKDKTQDQAIVVELIHQKTTETETKTVSRTVTFTGLPESLTPDPSVESVTLKINYQFDKVTNARVPNSEKLVDGTYVLPAVAAPLITGYTPTPGQIDALPVTDMNQANLFEFINYQPDSQQATISFVDDDPNQPTTITQTVDYPGTTGSVITNANLRAKALTGFDYTKYELVSIMIDGKDFTNQDFVYDNDDKTNQQIVFHLKHKYSVQQDTKTFTRNIIYAGLPDDATQVANKSQKVNATYQYTQDDTLGQRVSGSEKLINGPYQWDEVDTPEVSGFSVDTTSVPEKEINDYNQSDETVTVTYTADPRKAVVKFFDVTTNQLISDEATQLSVSGPAGTPVDLTGLWDYASAGYKLVDAQLPNFTFDHEYGKDETFIINVAHNISTQTGQTTFRRIIHTSGYLTEIPDVTDAVNVDYTYQQDDVTKTEMPGTRNYIAPSEKFPAYTPEPKSGYFVTPTSIPEESVDTNQLVLERYVVYSQVPIVAGVIEYVDIDNNNQIVKRLPTPPGEEDTTFDGAAAMTYDYEKDGYQLVEPLPEWKYSESSGTVQIFTVNLKHKVTLKTDDIVATRTIKHLGLQGKIPDETQAVPLTYQYEYDEVTKTEVANTRQLITQNPVYEAYTAPIEVGYSAEPTVLPELPIDESNLHVVASIQYTELERKGIVNYLDTDTGKNVATFNVSGRKGTEVDQSKVSYDYTTTGYELVSEPDWHFDSHFNDGDQIFTVKLKHKLEPKVTTKTVNRVINYVGLPENRPDVIHTATVTETIMVDQVTKQEVPDSEQQTISPAEFPLVDAPSYPGYQPDIQQVPASKVDPAVLETKVTITYQRMANVVYIDTDKDNQPISEKTVNVLGKIGDKVPQDKLTWDYQKAGYALVEEPDLTFNNHFGEPQTMIVKLKHQQVEKAKTRTITRTIKHVDAPVNLVDEVQTETITDTWLEDAVTGNKTNEKQIFSCTHFAAYDPTDYAGFTTEPLQVPALEINNETQDSQVTVHYLRLGQVEYRDGDKQNELLKTVDVQGKIGDLVNQADLTWDYLKENYVLADDQDLSKAFDKATNAPQIFTIYLKHKTEPRSEQVTKTRTIKHIGLPADQAIKDVTQKVTFTVTYDWDLLMDAEVPDSRQASPTTGELPMYIPPIVEGYYHEPHDVGAMEISASDPDPMNVIIDYRLADRQGFVKYIDDTTGKELTDRQVIVYGLAGKPVNQHVLWDYTTAGYQLVSEPDSWNFSLDNLHEQDFIVHLKHDVETITKTREVTRKISYQGTKDNIPAKTQKLTIEYTVQRDAVTKEEISGTEKLSENQDLTFAAVSSPEVAGYTPDKAQIAAFTIKNPLQEDLAERVTYKANPRTAVIKFVDGDDNNKLLKTVKVQGLPGTTVATKDQSWDEFKDKYVLVSQPDWTFDDQYDTEQTFTVVLAHKKVTSVVSKVVTRKIVFVGGPSKLADVIQQVTLTYQVVTDGVTGQEISRKLMTNKPTFAAYQTPSYNDYTVNLASVPALEITDETPINQTVIVIYTKQLLPPVPDTGRNKKKPIITPTTGKQTVTSTNKVKKIPQTNENSRQAQLITLAGITLLVGWLAILWRRREKGDK